MDMSVGSWSRSNLQTTSEEAQRKNVIGLDDLLIDYYKESGAVVERELKRAKFLKSYNSEEDEDDIDEITFREKVDQCQMMMGDISGEDEISQWGIQVFGNQQEPPPINFPEVRSCMPLQSFVNEDLNSLVELSPHIGESFLMGLLVNGWLPKLVFAHGHVEKSIAEWTCNLMFYSTQEDISKSAWDFWEIVLSSIKVVDTPLLEIHWLPSYLEIKRALDVFGFHFNISPKSAHDDSNCGGPPRNVRAWIRFVSALCQLRSKRSLFSSSEAEDLAGIVLSFFLCRELQGLLMLLHECWLSVIGYFTDEEWNASCNRIAKFLSCWVPRDVNCLQMVECISKVNARSQCLRSAVAYEILVACFESKVREAEEILRVLVAINLRDRSCDLFRVYIYLVLTENWLSCGSLLDEKPLISEMWHLYLRNCSYQITGSDLRSYASKVRTKATYLLQGMANL